MLNNSKMCSNKTRFANDVLAQSALKKINPAKASAGKPSRVYKCPNCSGYHLTRSPKK